MSTTQIRDSAALVAALSAAVAARKSSLTALRERIAALLAPLPIGVKLLGEERKEICRVVRICTGASQWSDRTWEVTIRGTGYLVDGKLLAADVAQDYFDGRNNLHTRSSEPYILGAEPADQGALRWLSGQETRGIAARLPGAIARYMADCETERQANNSETLTA